MVSYKYVLTDLLYVNYICTLYFYLYCILFYSILKRQDYGDVGAEAQQGRLTVLVKRASK